MKPESILDYTRVKMTVALRKFEAAHAIWMNTSVFSDEMPNVLNKRDDALTEYMVSVHEFEASVKTQQSETVAVREMNRRGELREVPAIEKEEPMKPKQQLTVDQLNDIQCEWMSLQAYDSPDEVKRITKALDSYPKCYVSLRPNKRGIVMARGIPTTSDMSLDDAFHYCALRPDSRTDIVWDGVKGAWREAKEVM